MKKLKVLLLLLIIPFAFQATEVQPKANKVAARRIIKKTAVVILIAHKKVKENKVYTGNLAKSIAHQKLAKKLYRNGKFLRAIHQSRRARILATMAIKANKGNETADMKYTKEDEALMKNSPKDSELDKELEMEMPGEPLKDEDILNTEPDVDINE